MSISLIAACGLNRELGYRNKLLCHLPNDLRHFKQLTEGHICVLGRKTYESIGKPLPNRHNIILSHKKKLNVPNTILVYNSVEEILKQYEQYSNKEAELFICGGEEVYSQFLPHADKIYLTIIDNYFNKADAYFPPFNSLDWKVIENIKNKKDENNLYDHYFVTYERKFNNK